MPVITCVQHQLTSTTEGPLAVKVSIRLATAGPITINFALDEALPYFFITAGNRVRELNFTRTFGSPGEHETDFTLSLGSAEPSDAVPSLTVRAAGIDGSSMPYRALLEGIEG